jgi:hypothetical protein
MRHGGKGSRRKRTGWTANGAPEEERWKKEHADLAKRLSGARLAH